MTGHPTPDRIAGMILCGGQSRRMGQPKAWLPLGDERMLQRMVRIVRGVLDPVIVVAAEGQELPELPEGIIIVRDDLPDRGPLQGLASGLARLPEACAAAFVTACDYPLLRPAFITRLCSLLGEELAVVPSVGGFDQPLAGVYRREVLPIALEQLQADRRALHGLLDALPVRKVRPAELADIDPRLDSLRNINTPAALAAITRELLRGQPPG